MYKFTVGKSANGLNVYVNLISSAAGKYLSRQPHVIHLIKEVLENSKLSGVEITIVRDMGRIIGNTDIVSTTDKDSVFYAKPNKTTAFSRYVKNRTMPPSTDLTILLHKDETGDYEILDTWIGPSRPPFPDDEKATNESKSYWENHALIADSGTIQSKTITKDWPY